MKKGLSIGIILLLLITYTTPFVVGDKIEPEPTTPKSSEPAWPMFGYDKYNRCLSPYSTDNITGIERWRYPLGATNQWTEISPVIDENNIVYIGCEEYLYSIYPNGTLKWIYDTQNGNLDKIPALDENGIIYVGSSISNNLYAIYKNNGTLKWIYNVGDIIYSSPIIDSDNIIYINSYNDLIAISSNGTLLWSFSTGDHICHSPAVSDYGIIYFGSGDSYLYALWKNNGTLLWSFNTEDHIACSPSIAYDGTIYINSGNGYLFAINPDGTRKWKLFIDCVISGAPAIGDDGSLYFCVYADRFYSINPDGNIKWIFPLGENNGVRYSATSISSDGTIYFANNFYKYGKYGGEIVALDLDGNLKWRKQITTGLIESSPAIASDGTIYIASLNDEDLGTIGYLHSFGPVESNNPPEPPNLYGDLIGEINREYEYRFSTTDPDNNPISYYVDWGDGTNSGWTIDYASGNEISLTHEWIEKSIYTVRVKARDSIGEESDWSIPLIVDMRMEKLVLYKNRLRFLNVVFHNKGDYDLHNFELTIDINTGSGPYQFGQIFYPREPIKKNVDLLKSGDSLSIFTRIRGIGFFIVEVEYHSDEFPSHETGAFGLLGLFFLLFILNNEAW